MSATAAAVINGPPCPVCGEPTKRTGKQGRPPKYDKPECRLKAKATAPVSSRPAHVPAPTLDPHVARTVPRLQETTPPERATVPTQIDEQLRQTRRAFFAGRVSRRAFVDVLTVWNTRGEDRPLCDASTLADLEELRGQE